MKIIILAGGKGTRLWPLSRGSFPKQFILLGKESLFEQSLKRALAVEKPENIFISTTDNYYFYVEKSIKKFKIKTKNIIIEPSPKNTGPAILFAIKEIKKRCKTKDELILTCPSDHFISPLKNYVKDVKRAKKIATLSYIVTFGIKPIAPETGYGYIGTRIDITKDNPEYYFVEKFVEKPNFLRAEKFLKAGNYFWNSGIFLFPMELMLENFKKYAPEINTVNFSDIKPISIDNAVIEKTDRLVTLIGNFNWSDVGSWDSFHKVQKKDLKGNVLMGNTLIQDVENSLILGNRRLIAGLGLRNITIVETEDVIFVSSKERSQEVRVLVEKLKKKKRKEAEEHMEAPYIWGNYAVLEKKEEREIRKITINTKKTFVSPSVLFNSKNWIIIKGKGRATIGKKEILLEEGKNFYIPKKLDCRIKNISKNALEIIEIENK